MLAGVSRVTRLFGLEGACLAVAFALAAGGAAAAQTAPGDADVVDAAVGGIGLRLTAPPGQSLGATALEPIYMLHDVSGDGLQALAVYLAPETARFFASRGQTLPAQGLMSTLIITERGLESRYVDQRALRDVLVDELKEQRQLQAFLASQRFGPQGLRVSLPETRVLTVEDFLIVQGNERLLPESGRRISYCVEAFLASQRFGPQGLRVSLPETRVLTVEDFLIVQGNERLLPESGRRISYCVEAFLALRNRPVLASTCLTKPEVSGQDMYSLETSVGAWARRLLADNPSSRAPAPTPAKDGAFQPTADTQPDPIAKRLAVVNLRSAADHRRRDVLVASALLAAQLPAEQRARLDQSSERFGRNVGSVCGRARDAALGYQCELIAFDRRLRALEKCTAASIAPALQTESVEPVAGQLPKT
jgi:hypothetical protein